MINSLRLDSFYTCFSSAYRSSCVDGTSDAVSWGATAPEKLKRENEAMKSRVFTCGRLRGQIGRFRRDTAIEQVAQDEAKTIDLRM